jgi:hypothetical protein
MKRRGKVIPKNIYKYLIMEIRMETSRTKEASKNFEIEGKSF